MTSRFAVAKAVALDHLESLVIDLLGSNAPSNWKRGGGWNFLWPWRANAKPSQAILYLTGARRGGFVDFVSGTKGDVIDLVAVCKSGAINDDSRMDAVRWIEDRFGLRTMDPQARARMEAEAKAARIAMEAAEARRVKERRGRARRFFHSCEPWEGTLVETYFRTARGFDLRAVPNLSHSIRFHPACEYWLGAPRDAAGKKAGRGPLLPAMITAMVDAKGHIGACHYTFLRPDGRDKAHAVPAGMEEPKAKMMFPETAGLTMRLTHGPSGLTMDRAAEAGISGVLGVTEGIEDALSAALSDPDLRCCAAGSLAGYMTLHDHPAVSAFLLFRDNDWDNPQALAQFDKALARVRQFGKPVAACAMPAAWGKDINDALRGGA